MSENSEFLNIAQLMREEKDTPLYVLNNSDLGRRRKKGDIMIVLNGESGDQVNVTIKNTWIPIDITRSVPRAAVLSSPNFRNAIANRILLAISASTAEMIMREEGASEEQDRIETERLNLTNAVDNVVNSGELGAATNSVEEHIRNTRKAQQEAMKQTAGMVDNGDANVTNPIVLNAMNNMEMRPAEKLNAIRSVEGELTEDDLNYIVRKAVPEDANLVAWCQTQLSKFRGAKR